MGLLGFREMTATEVKKLKAGRKLGNIVTIGDVRVKIASRLETKQHSYGRIMRDFYIRGETPLSLEFCENSRDEIEKLFLCNFNVATNYHASIAPEGASFKDAIADVAKKYGNRYNGYFVSEHLGGKKILLKLGKTVLVADAQKPRNEWEPVGVLPLVDHILSFELGYSGGKPNCTYGYDMREKAHIVEPDWSVVTASRPLRFERFSPDFLAIKDGIWRSVYYRDEKGGLQERGHGPLTWPDFNKNWNGLFSDGAHGTIYGVVYRIFYVPESTADVLIQVNNEVGKASYFKLAKQFTESIGWNALEKMGIG